jgi:lysophospholipase L1-like esterase
MPAITTPLQTSEGIAQAAQPKPCKRSPLRSAAELIALSAVAVLTLEGFFKVCSLGQQEFMEADPQLGSRHIPGKQVTWRTEGFSNDHFSSTGLRDREYPIAKPPGVTRIALLGDSSTEGIQVPLERTYAKVMERNLNSAGKQKFEVINFGTSAYSTGQEMLQYERDVRRYKPDIVVLLYNRGDSVENLFAPSANVLNSPRPYFYLDDQGKVQTDNSVMLAASSKLQPNPVMDYLKRYSRIYGVLSQTNFVLSNDEPQYRKLTGWWNKLTAGWTKNAGPTTWTVPYKTQDAEKVTAALIERLHHDVESDGAKFVLALFPNSVGDTFYMRQEVLYQRLAIDNHIPFLNLTGNFFQAGDIKTLFLSAHFSARGHELVAKELTPVIADLARK